MDIVRLSGGRDVAIRPIRPDDGDRLSAAHDRLSPETKYKRFLAPKPHLTSTDVRYLVEIDGIDHFALVATPVADPERIIGVARFVRLREDPQTAELAIVVGDQFQGEGLGTELLERLADAAAARGLGRLRATMLAENVPAHRLVSRVATGFVHKLHLNEIDEFEVDLAA